MGSDDTSLRTGFTTGACAAAAARAAWESLASGGAPPDAVTVRFPDGRDRRMPLAGARRSGPDTAEAWVVKDAGDDPDVTHGATVRARMAPCAEPGPADFVEACGNGWIVLRGGPGVGRVTRRGLDVPPGKWAINPVPRRMIVENLALAGYGAAGADALFSVEVAIDGGAGLAARTLNPVLGIEGGLSVLGTSGIVVPCSNQAYVATIRILLRGAREMGCATAVLATGGRTHRAAQPFYPALPEAAFVRIGDFIREAMDSAAELGFGEIAVACMAGKLAKYALGHTCTHAHVRALSMPELADALARDGAAGDVVAACGRSVSVRGFLETLDAASRNAILDRWATQALDTWKTWAPARRFRLLLFETDGATIGEWRADASVSERADEPRKIVEGE